ncbi:MAG: pilus assembly protein PilP [Xanthomonadaceae bacterium]|nr:pilus assembly protein PilP [Xanthomonadaceae bacterium]
MDHHIRRRARIAATALAACTALAGCSRGTEDLVAKIEEIKAIKGAPLEPLPVMKTFEVFEYNAQSLRDPFAAPVEEDATARTGPRPDQNRPKEALEAFPLDSLDMVGTLGLTTDVTGLVKDPDGVIHQIRPDNYLGQNFGRVTGIYEDRIELVELIPNGVGGWIERPASIALGEQ